LSQLRWDRDHFARVPFLPDPGDLIDRWFQVPDGRSVAEIAYLIDMLRAHGIDGDLLVDPFAGAGSAVIAAARRGMAFRGFDAYPPRLLYTLAKASAVAGGRGLVDPLREGTSPAAHIVAAQCVAAADPDMTPVTLDVVLSDLARTDPIDSADFDAWCLPVQAVLNYTPGLPIGDRGHLTAASLHARRISAARRLRGRSCRETSVGARAIGCSVGKSALEGRHDIRRLHVP
jgi:hypothetical protein